MQFHELYSLTDPPARAGDASTVIFSQLNSGAYARDGRQGFAVTYLGEGSQTYVLNGKAHTVEADQLLVIPPGVSLEYDHKVKGQRSTGLCMFLPEAFQPVACDLPLVMSATPFRLGIEFRQLARSLAANEDGRAAIGDRALPRIAFSSTAFFEEIGSYLDDLQCVKQSTRTYRYRQLERARAYLHSVTERRVDLVELSNVCGLSRYHLAHLFRDAFATSPMRYHRELRLTRARELIASGHYSCTSAARMCGFSDLSAFSRAFRRAFGVVPSEAAYGSGQNIS